MNHTRSSLVSAPFRRGRPFTSLATFAVALTATSVALAQPAPPMTEPAPTIGGPGAGTASMTPPPPPPDSAALPPPASSPAAPEPLIWRGTSFTWTQAATTTMLGIGRDNIGSEDEYYGWDFVLTPNLFVFDGKTDKILVFAEAGISVEWTDAGDTTTLHEPRFRDTQIGAGYNREIFVSDDKEWSTGAKIRVRGVIPTSPTSIAQGRYFTTSLGGTVSQMVRLAGKDADGLNNITFTGGLTWSHLFSRAFNPTNPNLERTRQNASGRSEFSDQLTFNSFDIDRLIPSIGFSLPLYKDLSMSTQFRLIGRFRHAWEGTGCDVVVSGQCVEAGRLEDPVSYLTNSTFDISFEQPIYDVVSLNVGYNNETLSIGEDGKSRNIFYSPEAQFYLDLIVNIDEIYSKASGRGEFETPPKPGARTAAVDGQSHTGMPSF